MGRLDLAVVHKAIFAVFSSGFLSTLHIVLGIIIALINIAILVPTAIDTYKNRHEKDKRIIKSIWTFVRRVFRNALQKRNRRN